MHRQENADPEYQHTSPRSRLPIWKELQLVHSRELLYRLPIRMSTEACSILLDLLDLIVTIGVTPQLALGSKQGPCDPTQSSADGLAWLGGYRRRMRRLRPTWKFGHPPMYAKRLVCLLQPKRKHCLPSSGVYFWPHLLRQ